MSHYMFKFPQCSSTAAEVNGAEEASGHFKTRLLMIISNLNLFADMSTWD